MKLFLATFAVFLVSVCSVLAIGTNIDYVVTDGTNMYSFLGGFTNQFLLGTNAPVDGYVIKVRVSGGVTSHYYAVESGGGGIVTNLGDCADVTLGSLTDAEVLTYDSGSGTWTNLPASGGGGGGGLVTNIADCADMLSVWIADTNWLFHISPGGTYTNLISKTYGLFTNALSEAGL